jgi:hypothetical protein
MTSKDADRSVRHHLLIIWRALSVKKKITLLSTPLLLIVLSASIFGSSLSDAEETAWDFYQAVYVNHEYNPAKELLSMDNSDMADPLERLMEAVQDAKTDPDDVKESSLRLYTVSSFGDHQKVLLYRPEDMDNSSSPCRK